MQIFSLSKSRFVVTWCITHKVVIGGYTRPGKETPALDLISQRILIIVTFLLPHPAFTCELYLHPGTLHLYHTGFPLTVNQRGCGVGSTFMPMRHRNQPYDKSAIRAEPG